MTLKTLNQVFFIALLIFLGEYIIFLSYPIYGLAVHIINLLITFILIIVKRNSFTESKDQYVKPVMQSLLLLLLLRMINMAIPIFFISISFWISIIYGIMFIPIYFILKNQNFSPEEIGLHCRQINLYGPSYVPVTLFIGYVLALIEFQIIHADPIIDNLSFINLLILILTMFIFVGLVEELIFRSILQTRLENAFGMKSGLLFASVLYAVMHSGYRNEYEILFAGFAGLIIGFIFQKTRCLPFAVGIQGTINIFVFGILPLLLHN